jgi:hypothetical protein
MHGTRTRRLRASTARNALLLGGLFALVLFVGLNAALELRHPEFVDGEYALRLRLLTCQLEEHPDRPLCLLLGTSRLAQAVLPADLPLLRTPDGRQALVFNACRFGGSPAMTLVHLRRYLAANVRPRWVVLEVVPGQLSDEEDTFVNEVLTASDLSGLQPFANPTRLFSNYARQSILRAPSYPAHLLGLRTPAAPCLDAQGGYGELLDDVSDGERRSRMERTRHYLRPGVTRFRVSPSSDGILRECLALCRGIGAEVLIVVTPEGSEYRGWYSSEANELLKRFLASLCESRGVDALDARDWLDDADFCDDHHVLRRGAERFTARFGAEILRPWIERAARTEGR